jgi:hypothetical protein
VNERALKQVFSSKSLQFSLSMNPTVFYAYVSLHPLVLSRTSDQPLAHLASCSVGVVDPSPALKQLMHEAAHLSLFSAAVNR